MSSDRAFTAEAAMAGGCGQPVRIDGVSALGDPDRRTLTLHAAANSPDSPARPVIVKATRAAGYDATARILHSLDVTVHRTQEAGVRPGIPAVAASWRSPLAGLWPLSPPLRLYPAFAAEAA